MTKRMLIDALHPEEMRVAIADNRQIFEFDFVSATKKQLKGNIYLAKITRVEPSLQAAFVEYGGGKQGFLPFAEIHPDYYQIPMSDREKLIAEVERESEESDDQEDVTNASPSEETDVSADEAPAEEIGGMPLLMQESALEESVSAEPAAPDRLGFAGEAQVSLGALAQNNQPEITENAKSEAAEPASDVETLENEEEEISSKRKRRVPFFKRYKIQEVIKRGQVVLVQVIKEERGNKGVSLTTYLSLAGRYCVLMPNSPRDGGVSRKISDMETRRRLKDLMSQLKLSKGMSVIIRTAGIDRTKPEIRRDFDYLVKLWNHIREETLASTAPALVYEENNLIKRAIRDLFTNDIEEVWVEGDEGYTDTKEIMKVMLPGFATRVKEYKNKTPIFYGYGIEDQLLSMYDPMVKLRSGGYIVLNPTEALISIDVNSGRSTSERNIEETATKTNMEAAQEIARQLRLRDLAGLIVIDFIDMMDSRNRRNVERMLKDALRTDRAKIQVGRISPFGLLEMSRQRLRPSISESSTVPCPHCTGRGVIRSSESLALQIMRTLEKEASTGGWEQLRLTVPESVALHLLNHKRAHISEIESRTGVQVSIQIAHGSGAFDFTIDKIRKSRDSGRNASRTASRPKFEGSMPEYDPLPENYEEEVAAESEAVSGETATADESRGDSERRGRKRGRRGGRGRTRRDRDDFSRGDQPAIEGERIAAPADADDLDAVPAEVSTSEEGEGRPERGRGRRSRGGRGRRRWREGDPETAVEGTKIEASHQEAEPQGDQAVTAELPAFTRTPVVETPKSDNVVELNAASPGPKPGIPAETTKRPDGTPPRKGWWQQIIELD